ncbi:NADH-quinone oxidoreductase subunit J [Paeniglutamicibacter gangotriensis]|uniref:NADH-quinone oxidoreductase subunit J n=1 Tax=Paeniglutamicibacter gangotriensis TaxID=254787 RepID=A0A5B0E671_9MICC|nr:NADH-quinone oxidoreductase subunit J [Paeniglutamicibacter gangotriensis]KAA0973421.1 NADH-quinone oxidoreductase subunit J [Paeniglutamicibacter gangotriensis]
MISAVLFWFFAAVALSSAAAVFVVNSMARASYALAASFIAVGAIIIVLELDYIGVITILMMVMEMAIMAVFMVMYMGMNPALMPMDMTHNKHRSAIIAVAVFIVLAAGALLIPWPERMGTPPQDATISLGESIMGSKMLVMLAISPVLFATIVASLVLANPRGRYDRRGDNLDRRGTDGRSEPEDPIRGGVGR